MDKLLEIPQETLDKLHDAVNEIENVLGHLCEIKLIQLDKHFDSHLLTIGGTNISLEIYDAIDEYKDLECIIANCGDNYTETLGKLNDKLYQKYNEERFSSICTVNSIETGYPEQVGICKKCNKGKECTYSESGYLLNINSNYLHRYGYCYDKCQICGLSWLDCKYYFLTASKKSHTIYSNKAEIIAKFRLIRAPIK